MTGAATARRRGQGGDRHDAEELRRFFTLAPEDYPVVDAVRGDGRRLARALLLVWARAERVLVADPTALPPPVIASVAAQLGLAPAVLRGSRGVRAGPARRAAAPAALSGVTPAAPGAA